MEQIFPTHAADVDPLRCYAGDDRHKAGVVPWLLINMIASADGGTAVDGVSGGLGGPADRAVFRAIRSVADVILVAAGTVRAENYGPPRTDEQVASERLARGQAPAPTMAVVTGSLSLEPTDRIFREADETTSTVVFTHERAPADRRAALEQVSQVVTAGTDRVDLRQALGWLGDRGTQVVLAEGGPSLNGQLIAAGLVDELCLALSPHLVSGESARVAHGPTPSRPVGLSLTRVLHEDGLMFCRYVTRH